MHQDSTAIIILNDQNSKTKNQFESFPFQKSSETDKVSNKTLMKQIKPVLVEENDFQNRDLSIKNH